MINLQNKEELKLKILRIIDSYVYPVGILILIDETRKVRSYVKAALDELKDECLVQPGCRFNDKMKYTLTNKGKLHLRSLK